MAQQLIDNGSFDNDPDAEKIREAFGKTNDNFTELYGNIGGDGKVSERIIPYLESGESELIEVANSVNAYPSLIVPAKTVQIVSFLEYYGGPLTPYFKKRSYIIKKGQGSYGATGDELTSSDFFILAPVVSDISGFTTIDLGDIGEANIWDYVNASGPYIIEGTTLFETTDGVYAFSGANGTYGVGFLQTNSTNFLPLNESPSHGWEKIHNLSLVGIATEGVDELTYIANAVFEHGPFTCEPDQQIILRTSTPYDEGIIERYYAVIPRVTTIGGNVGGIGGNVEPSFFRPDGQSISETIPSDIIVELGDIGTDDVEDAFNEGDGGEPWDMSIKRFIRATYDGEITLWSWQGEDGEFGGSGTPATADDFFLITGEPTLPYALFKQYATTTAMIADQANQLTKQVYRVLDASDDPNITFPIGETRVYAYYEKKLSVTTGDISDYFLISAPFKEGDGGESIEPQVTDDIHRIDPNIPAQIQPLSPLTTPTYDGSGQTTHPSVIYIKEGLSGYKYWMAHTPYAGADTELENPSIIASNDGITWETPAGITNPIVPSPAGADFNNDPCLVMGLDGKLWMYHGGTIGIFALNSVDGITWSAPITINSGGGPLSPINISLSVIIDGDGYATFGVNSTTKTMYRVLHTLPTSGYGSVDAVTINNMPAGKQMWHMEVRKYYEEYHLFACLSEIPTNSSNTDLYFGTSQDGLTFTLSDFPLSARMTGTWTESRVYKSSAILLNDTCYAIWLAGEASNVWRVGYSVASLDGRVKTTNAQLLEDTNRNPNVIYQTEDVLHLGDGIYLPTIPEVITGVDISFVKIQQYNTPASPTTGNITDDLTNARRGIIQKIYHNHTSEPTVPAGWVLLGGSYVTSSLNMIYATWSGGTRVEYWIAQQI